MHHLVQWLRELKTEAPWYFWAYVALTPLHVFLYHQPFTMVCTLAALVLYIYLLKTFSLLRRPIVYILAFVSQYMSDYIIEYFLGKDLHFYLRAIFPYGNYPKMYYIGITAVCSSLLAGAAALLYSRSPRFALQCCITICLMQIANMGGIILVLALLEAPFLFH